MNMKEGPSGPMGPPIAAKVASTAIKASAATIPQCTRPGTPPDLLKIRAFRMLWIAL